jgi:hypothetical protein
MLKGDDPGHTFGSSGGGDGQQGIPLELDGPILHQTLRNLASGARPLPEAVCAKLRADAVVLLRATTSAYESGVATGEIGKLGSARAGAAEPTGGQCPTGLLYGRVQSGKTVAMITFCAAALDNGFRVIVVLTSDNVRLVEQTAGRFRALDQALVKDSTRAETWGPDIEHIRDQIGSLGLVIVCAKNQSRLSQLIELLDNLGAGQYPALVLDDEADQATLDTTTAARAAQRANAPSLPSTINRRTVENNDPAELGASIRQRLPHHVFLQVTATPYALLLQNFENPLRPSFAHLLEPGPGYTGGEAFFSSALVDPPRPPIFLVDEQEYLQIQSNPGVTPTGLQQAIAFFCVSAAAHAITVPGAVVSGQNFLCHTSQLKDDHQDLADLVRSFVRRIDLVLRGEGEDVEAQVRLKWAYEELQKTSTPPPYEKVVAKLRRLLPRREVVVVNSNTGATEFGPQWNFIVGGNILGRGLTIENLLVTYYLRRAAVSQMDTVLQHARMFGYRQKLMPYTRVFLPPSLAFRFFGIHESEERLRASLAQAPATGPIPVQALAGLRPTRTNVLDMASLSAYGPGEQIYPIAPPPTLMVGPNLQIETELRRHLGGTLVAKEFVEIGIPDLVRLLRLVPVSESDAGKWDPELLGTILLALGEKYQNRGSVYFRPMERQKERLTTGAASGEEIQLARGRNHPVLFLFRDTGRFLRREFWYPTVFLPESMPTQVFTIS